MRLGMNPPTPHSTGLHATTSRRRTVTRELQNARIFQHPRPADGIILNDGI
jgi:hypothetical protein